MNTKSCAGHTVTLLVGAGGHRNRGHMSRSAPFAGKHVGDFLQGEVCVECYCDQVKCLFPSDIITLQDVPDETQSHIPESLHGR